MRTGSTGRLRPGFPVFGVLALLLLTCSSAPASAPAATSCAQIKSQPDRWVERKVNAIVLAARAVFEDEDAQPDYNKLVRGITATLRKCELSQDQSFANRNRKFIEFVEVAFVAQLADHELGFTVTDRQYFEETRQFVEIPNFLRTPEFLNWASRHETLGEAKAYLRALNSKRAPAEQLLFLSYESQHLGTPDNDDSYERLLIVVPGDAPKGVPEKWVQFGITDRGARKRVRNLSVVAALPQPDGSSHVYFKDFFRTYQRDGSISVNGRWELGYGDDNCVSCHKSGVLPIFPEEGSVSDSEQPALQAVNQRFLTYGPPNFEKYLDPSKSGPGLSSASEESRQQRFAKHFAATAEDFNRSTVVRAMTCSSCHEPKRLGSLNWPMDSVLIRSYIKGGRMPFGYKLQPWERSELYRYLVYEYFSIETANPGILKSFLLGRSDGATVNAGQ